ncbi:MAG TPA: helicase associated domain-containing protein [bacterium]|nr:helicase associated domain-containing protein [bacterium]
MIKGTNSIRSLIDSIDEKVKLSIETLNESINEIKSITGDMSKDSKEIIQNLRQISKDAKSKVSEINLPVPFRYEDFETGFQETIKFMETNEGDPNAPKKHVAKSGYSLWKWQEGQRGLYRKRKLEHDKIARLEEIGFDWTL